MRIFGLSMANSMNPSKRLVVLMDFFKMIESGFYVFKRLLTSE